MAQPTEEWDNEVTEEKPEEEEYPPRQYEIMNYPADTTLRGYLEQWDNKQLIVPPFQRGFVWDQVKSSKLIESFLLGLPVPGVFLYKGRKSQNFLIIDGQQRIKSIVAFLKGILNESTFRLKKVSKKWEGKRFEDLSEEEQFGLENSVMRAVIIQQLDPGDDSSIYHIFERLNTGGMNLNPMEIRQCVSFGRFVDVLKEMNSDENWMKIVGKSKPDNRLKDVELILRVIALRDTLEAYDKPMKGFLNDYMELQRKRPSDYEKLKVDFARVTERIVSDLGEKPFHIRSRLNYGALDSVMRELFRNPGVENLKNKYEKLQENSDYMEAITKNTSDTMPVKLRMDLVHSVFSG